MTESPESKLPPLPSLAYRRYLIVIITVGFALNLFDRQIVGILMQPIKNEFQLSDTQLGLLSGLAFAVFYATLGIPIAKLADRKSRRAIMSLSMAVWSGMTAIGGLAANSWQLILSRMGVGVGEAGFTPAAFSMIADYFPKHSRVLVISLVNIGPIIGIMLGLVVGGWAAETVGWRGALFIAGLPGLAFAALFWLTAREPIRGWADRLEGASLPQDDVSPQRAAPISHWRVPSYKWVVVGTCFFNFCIFGVATWLPSLLDRAYGIGPAQAGMVLGTVFGIFGGIGIVGGGWLAQRLARRDPRWLLWLPALAALLSIPLVAIALMSGRWEVMVGLYAVAYCFSFAYIGPAFSTVQSLVPVNRRAVATAWMMFFVNLVGLGLGPQIVGIASDLLLAAGIEQSLRYAMIAVSACFVIPSVAFLLAARTMVRDMDAADS